MGSNICMVVTSCNRYDLLKQTLDSFIEMKCGGAKPDACIIIEDSETPMPEWLKEGIHYYSANLGKVTWLQNDCRMGQIYSIDRAYQQIKAHEFVFHCEDDWLFTEGSFMVESKQILEKHPKIIQVSLRGNTGWHQLIDQPPYEGFKIAMPYWHGHWGGLSFNPGLRRLAQYKEIGSYGLHASYGTNGLGHEADLSLLYLKKGYVIADLNRPIVNHIGGSRSRAIEPLAAMPKILIAIPVCHKMDYGKWESSESSSFDPGKAYNGAAYGTDIHISGDNNRIQALRDTWLKDIEPFRAYVDYKLFYGAPHNREALSDEVYLSCPDDYASLPLKTVAICKYALEHGYKWIFKADDDTGIYVDRLIHELMSNRFDYAGYCHHSVCTGGTGYWLSQRALKLVAQMGGSPDHWAEDVWISKIMSNGNIYPAHLSGHRTGSANHWFFKDGFDPSIDMSSISTFHAVRPADMRAWYEHNRTL